MVLRLSLTPLASSKLYVVWWLHKQNHWRQANLQPLRAHVRVVLATRRCLKLTRPLGPPSDSRLAAQDSCCKYRYRYRYQGKLYY